MDAHIKALQDRALAAGMDYYLMVTDRLLDDALREYLTGAPGEWERLSVALVPRGRRPGGSASIFICSSATGRPRVCSVR